VPMIRYALTAMVVASLYGCNSSETAGRGVVVSDTVGDTIRTVTTEIVPRQFANGPTVLLHDDRLFNPRSMAANGGSLIIGDYTQVHILRLDDRSLHSVGGQGDGPGEYRSVAAVTTTPSGDILVLDDRQGRLSVLDSDGGFKNSRQLEALGMLRAPAANVLARHGGGVVLAWKAGVVNPGADPFDVAVVWQSDDGQVDELVRLKDIEMVDGGRMIVPKNPYGARPLIAVGPRGTVATSDGLDYCVTLRSVGDPSVRQLCREWQRVPAESDPSPFELKQIVEVSEIREVALESRLGSEELDLRNSIEGLLVDSGQNVWVKVLHPDSRYSTMIRHMWTELRPDFYIWDVLSPTGHRLAEVLFPNEFVPLLIHEDQVFGTLELETGELAIARFDIEIPRDAGAALDG